MEAALYLQKIVDSWPVEVVDYLFDEKKIMIKAVKTLKDRPGIFRISVGTAEENRECVEAVKAFFAARTG